MNRTLLGIFAVALCFTVGFSENITVREGATATFSSVGKLGEDGVHLRIEGPHKDVAEFLFSNNEKEENVDEVYRNRIQVKPINGELSVTLNDVRLIDNGTYTFYFYPPRKGTVEEAQNKKSYSLTVISKGPKNGDGKKNTHLGDYKDNNKTERTGEQDQSQGVHLDTLTRIAVGLIAVGCLAILLLHLGKLGCKRCLRRLHHKTDTKTRSDLRLI